MTPAGSTPSAGSTPPAGSTGRKSSFRLAVLSVALSCLTACASLGLQPADSFDARLAYAYGTHTAVLEAASTAVRAGTLSKQDGKTVLTLANQSRTLLDSARSVENTDPTTAAGRLTLAANVLSEIQTYLQSKGVK